MKSFRLFLSLTLLFFIFNQTISAQENTDTDEVNDLIIVEDSTSVKGSIFPLLRKKRNTSIKVYYLNKNEDGKAQADPDVIKTNENTRGIFAEYSYVRSELITYISSLQIYFKEYNGKRELDDRDRQVFNINGNARDISLTAGMKIEIDATSVFRQSNLEFRLLYFIFGGNNRDYIPLTTDFLASSSTSGMGTGYFAKYQHFYTPRLDFIFFTQNSNALLNNSVKSKFANLGNGNQGSSKEEVAILQLGGGIEYYFNLGGFRNDSIEALLDIKTINSEETEFENGPRFEFSQKKSIKDTLVTLSLQYQHSFNSDLDLIFYFGRTIVSSSENMQPPPDKYNTSTEVIPGVSRPQPGSNFTLNSEVSTVRIGAEYYFD